MAAPITCWLSATRVRTEYEATRWEASGRALETGRRNLYLARAYSVTIALLKEGGVTPILRGLRRARERRFVTMRELSERSGVSTNTLVNLERHEQEARMSTARKLAQALSCTADELLGEEQPGLGQTKAAA